MKLMHWILSAALLLAPAIAMAETAEALSPTAEAAVSPEPSPSPSPEPSPTPEAEQPPTLPESLDGSVVPADGALSGTAEVSTPLEDPAKQAPGEPVPEEKPSRYKLSNFLLGFLGGALLGGAYGVLSSGGKEGSTMGQNAAIYGGGAALTLGLAGLFLGATTPEEAKPPRVEGALPGAALALRF